jgi:hypothetical protein
MAGAGAMPGWLARAADSTDSSGRKKILVAIFQRGAADGLNTRCAPRFRLPRQAAPT